MKNITLGIVGIVSVWTGSFMIHPNYKSLEIVPEWNGPDYKVTYKCDDFKKVKGLHMEDKGSTVTVNYGAIGRRRKAFVCLDK